eukprot:scaffold56209_cov65-Cyclotella_meneghiniana.AAC.7
MAVWCGSAGQNVLSDGQVYKNRRVEIPPVTRQVDFCKPEHNSGHKRRFVSGRVGFRGNPAGQKI